VLFYGHCPVRYGFKMKQARIHKYKEQSQSMQLILRDINFIDIGYYKVAIAPRRREKTPTGTGIMLSSPFTLMNSTFSQLEMNSAAANMAREVKRVPCGVMEDVIDLVSAGLDTLCPAESC
jgi:hypothetical protein